MRQPSINIVLADIVAAHTMSCTTLMIMMSGQGWLAAREHVFAKLGIRRNTESMLQGHVMLQQQSATQLLSATTLRVCVVHIRQWSIAGTIYSVLTGIEGNNTEWSILAKPSACKSSQSYERDQQCCSFVISTHLVTSCGIESCVTL